MSETNTETIDGLELPTIGEIEQWMTELEETGVETELPCGKCRTPTVVTVPPEAKDDENQKTLCRECMVVHLRDSGLL